MVHPADRPTARPARCRRRTLLLGLSLAPFGAARAALSSHELARVERLLAMLSGRRDVRLVRNGKDYDNDTAVRFLRGKLDAMGGELKTAEEFIERIASRSSTTGQPYMVRLSDGREITAAEFLRLELVRLDKTAAR